MRRRACERRAYDSALTQSARGLEDGGWCGAQSNQRIPIAHLHRRAGAANERIVGPGPLDVEPVRAGARGARAVAKGEPSDFLDSQTRHLTRRASLLNRALIAFYLAVASFATGTFSELLGGGLASISRLEIAPAITEFGLLVAAIGTFAIATGAGILVAEASYALRSVMEEGRELRARQGRG